MTAVIRPRRSVLYMPGSNPRALDKGRALPCDGIVMDLEDAVAPEAKQAARDAIAEALSQGGYGSREILIRVNGLDTPWGHDDLLFAAAQPAHGIILSKVESGGTVRQAESLLIRNGAPETMGIWCMVETPRGVLAAQEIASATPRMAGLMLGTNDLAKDLQCLHTPDRMPLMTSFGLCLLAARAYGIAILDGVHADLNDDEGFAAVCRQGRELGFDGKTLIHPKTIAAANAAFSPREEDIAWARKIAQAHAAAMAEGKGVLQVDGKLVEGLHVAEAQRLVAMADMIAEIEGASA
ncbi:CoA ester lyase [Thalassobaculum sp. OXR-137]|uniref:HpcH/HpaI aldolase/citrate lyase family protein n=1 Tax=Thalassobaculum sp. OXR-137 TaxID=3100173 RepID=UPI002AC90844|nr:CoA ester lyase [Thalassobaculum sp. OXR-137]WPZ35625.1 CoA ester lyase [Thalassobaculum sp. OXR-137]